MWMTAFDKTIIEENRNYSKEKPQCYPEDYAYIMSFEDFFDDLK